MGKVVAQFSMSLDGFIADADDNVAPLMQWYRDGDTDFPVPSMNMNFRLSRASADLLQEQWSALGALVTGRRDFDVSDGWGGKRFMDLPTFIVTHSAPQEWAGEDSPFSFVTDGVGSAIRQAQAAAGDKHVGVSGSKVVQQCLTLGLVDEINIDLVPILLGDGIRLFDNLCAEPVQLESTRVVETPGVTHLGFRVVR